MATRTVTWTSFGRLSCAGCTPADVILCTTFNGATVDAQLIAFQRLSTGCGGGYFQYTFTYDTEKLPDGVTGLTCADITNAFCKGCLTQWVINQLEGLDESIIERVNAIVTAAIAAARPLIFNSQTTDAVFSFMADSTTTHDVDLIIANPSATRPLEVDISWGWGMNVQSGGDYNDVSMTGSLYIDGIAITGLTGTTRSRWAVMDVPNSIEFAGPQGGDYHVTVAAGGSITATLRMSATVDSPAPDVVFSATRMFVSAYGVTS